MKWIVLEENPKPDQYIAVIAADDDRVLKVEMRACSYFKTQTEALLRARQLLENQSCRLPNCTTDSMLPYKENTIINSTSKRTLCGPGKI